MSETTNQDQEMLRALDPDLPFLAARAAVELDNLILNQPTSLDSVKQIASLLQGSTTLAAGGQRKSLMDPATVDLVGRAIIAQGDQVMTITALAEVAARIADELASTEQDPKRNLLEKMRTFCVALSREASAYMSPEIETESPHPFRR